MTVKRFPRFHVVLIGALVLGSALTLRGSYAEHRALLSSDLEILLAQPAFAKSPHAKTRVIVPGTDEQIDDIARRLNLRLLRRIAGGGVFLVNAAQLRQLAAESLVNTVSGDLPIRASLSISNLSTAADKVRAGTAGLLLGIGGIPGATGKGVGVAVVDSGISFHKALANRVIANVSYVTGDSSTDDAYGHGTHVAGIIAGAVTGATPVYTSGIAPAANLINVRVLGAAGYGYTSDAIAGIDWVIANRLRYNIRVMNLSFGHPVTTRCELDPLCQAVGRAYANGITVVAAAGNYGVAPDGRMILGGIVSPGNSPFAITVGALSTKGTTSRSDDVVTPYSSRGPAAYDFTVKPDVAAPGDKIVSLEAENSYLATHYPYLHKAGSGTNAYMQLSGTSMAAPMVSGAAALLLSGQSGLSPAQIKFALQTGAVYMKDAGLIGAGAGSVNFWTSRSFIYNGLINSVVNTLSSLLGSGSGIAYWDAGTMSHRIYNRTGIRLLSLTDVLAALLNPSILRFGDLNLVGLSNPIASMTGNWITWGEVAGWTGSEDILWGTKITAQSGDDILWGTTGSDDILWGTGSPALTADNPW